MLSMLAGSKLSATIVIARSEDAGETNVLLLCEFCTRHPLFCRTSHFFLGGTICSFRGSCTALPFVLILVVGLGGLLHRFLLLS